MVKRKRGRAIGEGSVYQNPERGNWTAQVRINGRKVKRSAPTQREALDLLNELSRERRTGVVTSRRETVGQFMTTWLEGAERRVRPETNRGYAWRVKRYIIPALGRIPLAALRPEHVERLLSDLSARGLSPRSVAHVRAVLQNALGQAERWGLVPRNVAHLVSAPRVPNVERRALSAVEVRQLLAQLDGDAWRPCTSSRSRSGYGRARSSGCAGATSTSREER